MEPSRCFDVVPLREQQRSLRVGPAQLMWTQESSPAWIPNEPSLKSPSLLVFRSLLVQGREEPAQKVTATDVGERDLPLGEGHLPSGTL